MGDKRIRRTKKEVLQAKISNLDVSIAKTREKLKVMKEDRKEYAAELAKIIREEEKYADQADMRDIARLIKEQNLTLDELRVILESKETEEKEDEEE